MKKLLKKQFEDIQRDLATAVALCDTLQDKVHDLEERIELEEKNKMKPMMYSKNGVGYEISSYHKYPDSVIMFTLAGNFDSMYRYRVGQSYDSEYIYPNKKAINLYLTVHTFEELTTDGWICRDNWIDRIELLEGVDKYDRVEDRGGRGK